MGPEQFAALWQSDTPYRQGALRLLEPFLGGRDWRDCMAEYVEFQRTLLGDEAPEVAAKFEQAAKEWAVA